MTALFVPAATVSHAAITPYISLEEYEHAPTAVDVSTLTTPGYQTDQNIELANVIRRATAWANSLCHQILAATLDVQTATDVYVRRDATVRLPCDFWPVRELDSFSAGPRRSAMTALTTSTSATADIDLIGRKVLVVPVAGLAYQASGNGFSYHGPIGAGSRICCQWGYWNGWFHTTLGSTIAANVSTIPLTTTLPQSAAGTALTIVDGASTEIVTVDSTFTGGTSLPLAAPTVNAHTFAAYPASTTITELPDDARQAVISLTSALIKTKGAESYVMASIAGQAPSTTALIASGGMVDLKVAAGLLAKYARTA